MKIIFPVIFILLFSISAYAEIIFVSSVKTSLYKDADRSSQEIAGLKKGDQLNSLEEKNGWLKASFGNKTGWIQKLFTSREKPGNKVTLFGSEAKKARIYARKRASSDVTAASARGLMDDSRSGRGRAKPAAGKYDPEAVSRMERITFSEDELMEFLEQGGISR